MKIEKEGPFRYVLVLLGFLLAPMLVHAQCQLTASAQNPELPFSLFDNGQAIIDQTITVNWCDSQPSIASGASWINTTYFEFEDRGLPGNVNVYHIAYISNPSKSARTGAVNVCAGETPTCVVVNVTEDAGLPPTVQSVLIQGDTVPFQLPQPCKGDPLFPQLWQIIGHNLTGLTLNAGPHYTFVPEIDPIVGSLGGNPNVTSGNTAEMNYNGGGQPGGPLTLTVTTPLGSTSVMLTFPGNPVIQTASPLPPANAGMPYSVTFEALGGVPPYTWTALGIPIVGGFVDTHTPTIATSDVIGPSMLYQFSVQVTDSLFCQDSKAFSLQVNGAPTILNNVLAAGYLNTNYGPYQLVATGGTEPYSWTVSGLPDGLTASQSGVISGAPTDIGISTVTLNATDSNGAAAVPVILTLAVTTPCGSFTVSGANNSFPMIPLVRPLKSGDYINLTAVLSSSHPGANGSGPILRVFDDTDTSVPIGGYAISLYGSTFALSFDISQDGAAIDAGFVNGDATESATLEYCINAPKLYTFAQKRADMIAATNLFELAVNTFSDPPDCDGGDEDVCNAITDSSSLAFELGGLVLNNLAGDPPDPNFTVLPIPNIQQPSLVSSGPGISQPQANAVNALNLNLATALAYAQAQYTSLNRASGAYNAGNSTWLNLQLQASRKYSSQFALTIQATPGLLTNSAQVLPQNLFTLTPSDIEARESILLQNGLPTTVVQALAAQGLDNKSIQNLSVILAAQDPAQASGTFPALLANLNLISALRSAGSAFADLNDDGKIDCTDLGIVKAAFGKSSGESGYDARADVNGDGVVNILDLALVAKQLPAGTVCQ